MAKKLEQQIAFRVSYETYNKLADMCVRSGSSSLSGLIRRIVEESVQQDLHPPIEQIKDDLGNFIRERVHTADVLRHDLSRVQESVHHLDRTCQGLHSLHSTLKKDLIFQWSERIGFCLLGGFIALIAVAVTQMFLT